MVDLSSGMKHLAFALPSLNPVIACSAFTEPFNIVPSVQRTRPTLHSPIPSGHADTGRHSSAEKSRPQPVKGVAPSHAGSPTGCNFSETRPFSLIYTSPTRRAECDVCYALLRRILGPAESPGIATWSMYARRVALPRQSDNKVVNHFSHPCVPGFPF